MNLKQFKELQSFLASPKNIVIIGHRNPDGDAIGASLALSHYLKKKGHYPTVVVPNEYPNFLHWLPGSNNTYRFDWQNSQSQRAIKKSDIIFLLDFNALHRVGHDMQNTLEAYENDFVLIDHHQQPDEFKYMFSDPEICSTCQMVYHFIEIMEDIDLIDADIATCLYTGIMTDTGSFRFRSTTSLTHRIVADLIDKGAENDKIHSNVYDSNSYERLQLLGKALSNLKVFPEYRTAYITISDDEKKSYNFVKGDTEGFVNYALSVTGIFLAAIFIEDKEQRIIKISFRSKGSFSVNKLARENFNGGGHHNAAGGKSTLSMDETIKKFISLLPKNKLDLVNSYEA
ncbi:MAG: Bifunctional oligoribonuclease and PAP phosphatase NrnA [Flavobacterium sp. SCGC AAA160-P02]|nr:MAG: Bifunctional oligoribonuclease and PAP phosphatase NrnA [Flavobacterium sp. SCGC AAA160-P02]